MQKIAVLSMSFLAFMLVACGDNIHPSEAGEDGTGDECFDEGCPTDVDQPDAGTPTPDGDPGGEQPDGGTPTDGGGQPDGGGTDGGGDPDGGTNECSVDADCDPGQACHEGTCVCDHDGEVEETGCAPEEVQLCHVPPGNAGEAHGICVGASAAEAHLGHGDTLGACP